MERMNCKNEGLQACAITETIAACTTTTTITACTTTDTTAPARSQTRPHRHRAGVCQRSGGFSHAADLTRSSDHRAGVCQRARGASIPGIGVWRAMAGYTSQTEHVCAATNTGCATAQQLTQSRVCLKGLSALKGTDEKECMEVVPLQIECSCP
eukprot:1148468-Pelagomonas_calceolata.AAC.11